jgi:hypothetical protein
MSSSPDAQLRFPLNSYGYFPRWAEYMLYGSFAVIGAFMLVTLIFDPGWIALFGLAIVVVGWVGFFLAMGRLRDREANYVELGATSFELIHSLRFVPSRLTVQYEQVASVDEGVRQKSFLSYFWPHPWRVHLWPYPMRGSGEHIEVRLTVPIGVSILYRFPPWVQVIDLDTERADELAWELRARVVAAAGTSQPPIA